VVVIGGGMAGCAAASSARRAGAEVTLLERTDRLGGLALFAGAFRMNGQLTAHEELIELGAGDMPGVLESIRLYSGV